MSDSSSLAIAALVGAATGLHAATWGMYKDALYEGFSRWKFARSVLIGAASGAVVQSLMRFDLRGPAGFVLLAGLAYALERGIAEWHKSFVREEDQSKYFIPMQLAVGGRIVRSRVVRALSGLAYAGALAAVAIGLARLGDAGTPRFPLVMLILLGSVGGWISAFGGAWKDAPREGFQTLKFFRSPAVAVVYALALSALTTSWLAIAFGALGFTIATIETHKMFDNSHERGKFAGKPVRFPDIVQARRRYVPVYLALWAAMLVTLAAALSAPATGLLAAIDIAALRGP